MENKEIILSRKAYFAMGFKEGNSTEGANVTVEVHFSGHVDTKTDLVVNLMDVQACLMPIVQKYDHEVFQGGRFEFLKVISQQIQIGSKSLPALLKRVSLHFGDGLSLQQDF